MAHMSTSTILKHAAIAGAIIVSLLAFVNPVGAVPSFARQTGQECPACHVSWPELTPYGRYFKLTGYTIGKPFVSSEGFNYVPVAAMLQASISNVRNNSMIDPDSGDTVPVMQRQNSMVFSGGSLFFATKLSDYVGAFVQWTYDNLATTTDGTLGGHSAMDNTEIRGAYKYSPTGAAEPEWIFGATLNNNPTMQDPWNSTPAWGFPFATSPLAPTPAAATLIDGGLAQQVAGLGAYAYWQKTIYAEFSAYRTANVLGNALRQGQPINTPGGVLAITNFNPYWRLAYSHDWGPNSIMLGTYGMVTNVYPDNLNTTTPTDRYRDIAIDGQYQYITDMHTFTAQATYIWEKQSYNASYPITQSTGAGYGAGPTPANANDTLETFRVKGTYYYERKYGATLQLFQTRGSADEGLYGTTASGDANTPNSSGYIAELDWLPVQNLRLLLQYTGYNKFNGASSNYDGNGRNAKDNNTLFFDIWVAF
jgi:hypothetical protein